MNTALFAGTVFKGASTHSLPKRAVKILHFAQSAGNFSSQAEGSSETTRADSSFNFNANFGALVDRFGYFLVRPDGSIRFRLRVDPQEPLLAWVQTEFSPKFSRTPQGLLL
jgi:hypothetical protein